MVEVIGAGWGRTGTLSLKVRRRGSGARRRQPPTLLLRPLALSARRPPPPAPPPPQTALEALGYDPCYHMQEVFSRPSDAALWVKVADGGR